MKGEKLKSVMSEGYSLRWEKREEGLRRMRNEKEMNGAERGEEKNTFEGASKGGEGIYKKGGII